MRELQRDYELMFIISPLRSSEEDVTTITNRVQQSVASIGGEVISSENGSPWGRRKLAYPIRRYSEGEASRRSFNEGFYVLMRLSLPTTQLNEFERQLKLNEAVIRHLVTLVDQRGQVVGAASGISESTSVIDDADDTNDDDE
ncbi:MAG: 30S ribosomal protein S6 [Roseiflexaceae bacterium]|nr:30S ribosomal protein S6 [Roseiflexaceae bacterium]